MRFERKAFDCNRRWHSTNVDLHCVSTEFGIWLPSTLSLLLSSPPPSSSSKWLLYITYTSPHFHSFLHWIYITYPQSTLIYECNRSVSGRSFHVIFFSEWFCFGYSSLLSTTIIIKELSYSSFSLDFHSTISVYFWYCLYENISISYQNWPNVIFIAAIFPLTHTHSLTPMGNSIRFIPLCIIPLMRI